MSNPRRNSTNDNHTPSNRTSDVGMNNRFNLDLSHITGINATHHHNLNSPPPPPSSIYNQRYLNSSSYNQHHQLASTSARDRATDRADNRDISYYIPSSNLSPHSTFLGSSGMNNSTGMAMNMSIMSTASISMDRMGDEGYTPRHSYGSGGPGSQKHAVASTSVAATRKHFHFNHTHQRNKHGANTNNNSKLSPINTSNTDNDVNDQEKDEQLHNTQRNAKINMTDSQLLSIIRSCLTSQVSPSTCAFYAGILYARHQEPQHSNTSVTISTSEIALLYAKALFLNHEEKRATFVLETSGLITPFQRQHPTQTSSNLQVYIEASLLASKCLCNAGEYEGAYHVLEEISRYPPPLSLPPNFHHHLETARDIPDGQYSNFTKVYHSNNTNIDARANRIEAGPVIEDGNDIALDILADLVNHQNNNLPHNNNNINRDHREIHPMSQLCCARGVLLDLMGNPQKAKSFLVKALKMDAFCFEAFDVLTNRNLCSLNYLEDLVRNQLNFGCSTGECHWLKDFYLLRICNSYDHEYQHQAQVADHDKDIGETKEKENTGDKNNNYSATNNRDSDHDHDKKKPAEKPEEKMESKSTSLTLSTPFQRLCTIHNLSKSSDVLSIAAINAYYNQYSIPKALSYCLSTQKIDPHNPRSSYVYASCLFFLKQKQKLFDLSHKTVSNQTNKKALGWFCVGCYYLLCERYEIAQKHFCRATRLDPKSLECWLGFGLAFAYADESDQALAAFRAALRLGGGGGGGGGSTLLIDSKNDLNKKKQGVEKNNSNDGGGASHFPILYIGMEYLRTNHLTLAQHFLNYAAQISASNTRSGFIEDVSSYHILPTPHTLSCEFGFGCGDPTTFNELGVCAYRMENYEESIKFFVHTLRICAHLELVSKSQRIIASRNGLSKTKNPLKQEEGEDQEYYRYLREQLENMSDLECILSCDDSFWEPTIFNLGQSFRKARKFKEASLCFEKSVSLCPVSLSLTSLDSLVLQV